MRQALLREQALIFVFDPYERCVCTRNEWAPLLGRRNARMARLLRLKWP